MIKQVYGIRDTLAGETLLLMTEKNDELLKRVVKALLLDRRPNPINSETKDTLIFELGSLDTESGIMTSLISPRMALNVEIVRQELLQEIRISKMMAGDNSPTDKLPAEEEEEKEGCVEHIPHPTEMSEDFETHE